MTSSLCHYFPKCSGCSSWNQTYEEQIHKKKTYLRNLFQLQQLEPPSTLDFISCGEHGLRQRVDFTLEFDPQIQAHKTGFYDRDKNLLNIEKCLQLSPELQKHYSEFIALKFFCKDTPLKKGSVRLRNGPDGLKGCWLDFSNLDIKNLLEDQVLLKQLLADNWLVEIGQKGKKLSLQNGTLKLTEAQTHNWFKTCDSEGTDLSLSCLVSDFTQPSWQTATTMVQLSLNWIQKIGSLRSVLEFGPGIGQFTIGFLKSGLKVNAFEVNESACQSLAENAKKHGIEHELSIHIGDYQNKSLKTDLTYDLAFVNPARSGLKKFTEQILKIQPEHLIYISCFPKSMLQDFKKLSSVYELIDLKIIDQFPQTEHFETALLLKKLS
jgi:23S rRNA (uracil1939-C5)-methyltransferase